MDLKATNALLKNVDMEGGKKDISENLNKKPLCHIQNYADVNMLTIDKPRDSEIVPQEVLSELSVDADIIQVEVQTSVRLDNNVAEQINFLFSENEMGVEFSHAKIKCSKNEGKISNALSDHNYTSQEMDVSQQNLYTIREMLLNQIFLDGFSYQCIPKSVSCFIDRTLAKIQILQCETRLEMLKDSQKSSEVSFAQDVPENGSERLDVDLNDEYFESLYTNVVNNNNTLKTLLSRTMGFAKELFNNCKRTTIKSEYAFNLFIVGQIQKLRKILTIDSTIMGTQTSISRKRFLKKRSQQNYDARIKLLRKTSSSSTIDSNINNIHTKINISTSSICESDLGLSKLTGIKHCKNYTPHQKQDLNDEIDLSKYMKLDVNCRKFKEDSWIQLKEYNTSDDDTDKEIERLTNLNGLKRRYMHHVYSKAKEIIPWKPINKKITDNYYELEDNLDSYETDNSLKKSKDEIITEHQYLSRRNDQIKHQLLNESNSNSGLSDYCNISKESCSDKEADKAIDIVEKFLLVLKSEPPYDEESRRNSGSDMELLPKGCDIFKASTEVSNYTLNRKNEFKKSFETMLSESDKRNKHEEIILSSESEFSEIEAVEAEPIKEKSRLIKPMLRIDQLANETRAAQKSESDRIRRLEKQHAVLSKALKNNAISIKNDDLVLDYIESEKTFVKVDSEIVKQLKPHQIDGVRFMYDSCFGGSNHNLKISGSGCILAHCMGLGKTLQLIALLHTVISYKVLNTKKVMILCPKSTVMNWADEFQRWLSPLKINNNIKVYVFPDSSDISEKLQLLEDWSLSSSRRAGCLLVGYEAFRTLVFYHSYKNRGNFTSSKLEIIRDKVKKYLLDPGSDLVVCDEGHIIKNSKSAISLAVAQIKTTKRIILTGTPIQNNLKEYYSMVNFIKPLYLGTEREFANLYANPIKNGQHKDSGKKDITVMKQRSYVLHKKLSKFVQRKEAELLKTFLPQKFEYVLFIPMTNIQNTLYEYILDAISVRGDSRGKSLITDYTVLRKIWTHPKVLEDAWKNANIPKIKKEAKKVACQHSDEDQPDDIYDRQTGVISVTNDWWRQYLSKMDLETIMPSNKLRTMFSILRLCEEKGEKCLIFSAFVAVLNVVEYFFKKINESDPEILQDIRVPASQTTTNKWINGQDYYRLDGKTPKNIRHEMIKRFNNESNRRARVFLISAKAGGQGINLVGANRVIILDTSWNPSNDQQNIFRIFRLGQKKNCYIYRLIAMGTMEEKVYSRSVTKQAMSFRVVDEQQIDRHYNMAELAELYTLTKPEKSERTVPVLPKDKILAYLLRQSDLVYKYHEHDSLLESKIEQELSEQEKADAWETYEKELQLNLTQQDALNTDRVQNILSSKSSPYSGLTVPNLDMQTLLNYSFQSASFIPHYSYSLSPNYLETLNLYQKYSMQYSDINSSINDNTYNSPHFKAISTSTPNGLPTSTSIMPNVLSPKRTLSDFGLFEHQNLQNTNSPIQHTFSKDIITTNIHKSSNLMEYQQLLENPFPSLLNFSTQSYTPTTNGILSNSPHKTMNPLQNNFSFPTSSGNSPDDIENIIAKNNKVLNVDVIGQTANSINEMTAQIATTNESSLKVNLENMSVKQHEIAPISYDKKSHKKKKKLSKSDNSNILSLTKDYRQNNAEMEIIPTISPPETSSITKQLNEMSPSISVTAVQTLKEKVQCSTQEQIFKDNQIETISNIPIEATIFNSPTGSESIEKTGYLVKNVAAGKIESSYTSTSGNTTKKVVTKSFSNLTTGQTVTTFDSVNNQTIQASLINNAISIRPISRKLPNIEKNDDKEIFKAALNSEGMQLSVRKRQPERSQQNTNAKRTKF